MGRIEFVMRLIAWLVRIWRWLHSYVLGEPPVRTTTGAVAEGLAHSLNSTNALAAMTAAGLQQQLGDRLAAFDHTLIPLAVDGAVVSMPCRIPSKGDMPVGLALLDLPQEIYLMKNSLRARLYGWPAWLTVTLGAIPQDDGGFNIAIRSVELSRGIRPPAATRH